MPILLYPLRNNPPITQYFGENPQWYPLTKGHNGIDWGVPIGTPVYAAAKGLVTVAGPDTSGYGHHVRIQHADCLTIYGHLDTWAVARDDTVEAGQLIGYSGNTGNSTGPHLHFELRLGSTVYTGVDPMPFLTDSIPEAEKPMMVAEITASGLRVRKGPGQNFGTITILPKGTKVSILRVAGDTIWYQIPQGFIAGKFEGDHYIKPLDEQGLQG